MFCLFVWVFFTPSNFTTHEVRMHKCTASEVEKSWRWKGGHGWQWRRPANIPKHLVMTVSTEVLEIDLCYTCYVLVHCREVTSIQRIVPPALCMHYPSMPGISFGILAGGSGAGELKGGCAGWQLQQEGVELWSTHTLVIVQAEWNNLPYAVSSDPKYGPNISSLGKRLL